MLLLTGADPVEQRRQQKKEQTAFVTFHRAAEKWYEH